MQYEVIMSIYIKVPVKYLQDSVESLLNQSALPTKIFIAKDGPLTEEQNKFLDDLKSKYANLIEIISYEQNRGCGPVYNDLLKLCREKYAMIMDSDDYIVPNKAEYELNFLMKNPDYDLVGSNVYEFIDNIKNTVSFRKLPETNEEIVTFAHKRCPIAQPTAMFKVKSVIDAGGYQPSLLTEDYDLYIRMIMNKCKLYNIQECYTYMRVNEDFYDRRGGLKYLKPILSFKYKWYKKGFYSLKEFIKTAGASLIVSLLPNKLRTTIYKKLLRKEAN